MQRSSAEPLRADSRFSYRCMACGRCCAKKNIRVNPFEIAMLAQHRGASTTELMAQAIEADAPVLRAKDDGFCIFFEPGSGCTVHPARPLACRLYPLGMQRRNDQMRFTQVEPHPQTDGVYGEDGTVADYIAGQSVADYVTVLEAYRSLIKELYLSWSTKSKTKVLPDAAEVYQPGLVDIDAMIPGEYRRLQPQLKAALHFEALRARFNPGAAAASSSNASSPQPTVEELGAALATLVYALGIAITVKAENAAAAASPGAAT